MAELTPMKMQYQQIKSQYSDCLLFFRLGDFYEMFDEDARVASRSARRCAAFRITAVRRISRG